MLMRNNQNSSVFFLFKIIQKIKYQFFSVFKRFTIIKPSIPFVFCFTHSFLIISIRQTVKSSFNIIHRATMFKVDFFIPLPLPFLQSQLARARRQTFTFDTEVSAKFASPEDTVLAKLEWYRLGGEVSDRQWRDVLGVLKTRAGELDLDYLRKWACELNVGDLLERALKEAE